MARKCNGGSVAFLAIVLRNEGRIDLWPRFESGFPICVALPIWYKAFFS